MKHFILPVGMDVLTGRNLHEWQGHITYTYICTGRKAAASEHQTLNVAVTSSTRYRYTNFVANLFDSFLSSYYETDSAIFLTNPHSLQSCSFSSFPFDSLTSFQLICCLFEATKRR